MRVIARRLALFTALSTMFALFAVGGTATATHGGRTLQVTPESDTNVAGSAFHVLTATLSAATTTEVVNVDFEIESGPSDTDANTPTTPDLTCTVATAASTCTVQFVSTTLGTDVVRAWIDHDFLNSTTEADATEGLRADATADEPATGTITPGAEPEPDVTDVVRKIWSADAARIIELTPETDTNPSGTIHRVVATVHDGFGDLAEGAVVTFTETGTGRFAANADDEDPLVAGHQVTTDANGEAETFTETFPGEEGDQSITGTLNPATTDCELAVNDPIGAAAGDCNDTVAKTWGPGGADDTCTITGTEGDDVLEGTDGDDTICGLAGNDTIRGLGGNDVIRAGLGNDNARGGAGNDNVRGAGGTDALRGGGGDDGLRGGRDNDNLRGGAGNDNLRGGRDNDNLRGGSGSDICRGGPGADVERGCES